MTTPTFESMIARDLDEFERIVSAAWRHVIDIDGDVPRPRIKGCKLHDGHMIVGIEIGEKRLTLAVPTGAFKQGLH